MTPLEVANRDNAILRRQVDDLRHTVRELSGRGTEGERFIGHLKVTYCITEYPARALWCLWKARGAVLTSDRLTLMVWGEDGRDKLADEKVAVGVLVCKIRKRLGLTKVGNIPWHGWFLKPETVREIDNLHREFTQATERAA